MPRRARRQPGNKADLRSWELTEGTGGERQNAESGEGEWRSEIKAGKTSAEKGAVRALFASRGRPKRIVSRCMSGMARDENSGV